MSDGHFAITHLTLLVANRVRTAYVHKHEAAERAGTAALHFSHRSGGARRRSCAGAGAQSFESVCEAIAGEQQLKPYLHDIISQGCKSCVRC